MSTKSLNCQKVLQEFLDAREWEDEIDVDSENNAVRLATGVDFGEHKDGRLYIEASDENSRYAVYFYLPFKCKESKFAEMCVLLNTLNNKHQYGRFELTEIGQVRWMQKVDFEGVEPNAWSIELMVGPGWDAMAYFADTFAAVALTKATAEEAIQQLMEEENNSNDSDGPTEL